jgi:hypothetical protein
MNSDRRFPARTRTPEGCKRQVDAAKWSIIQSEWDQEAKKISGLTLSTGARMMTGLGHGRRADNMRGTPEVSQRADTLCATRKHGVGHKRS